MLADTFGRPLRFRMTAGQAHDITAVADLLEGQQANAVLASKAYDGNDLRELIAGMKAEAVIPSKRNRKVFIPMTKPSTSTAIRSNDALAGLKHFRRLATRYNRRTIHLPPSSISPSL